MSRSLQRCVVQGWQGSDTSVPEERRLKGSVWPGAGSLSFFYPLDNNTDKRLPALPAAPPIHHRKELRLTNSEQK